jgi:hypothetical protein
MKLLPRNTVSAKLEQTEPTIPHMTAGYYSLRTSGSRLIPFPDISE